MDMFIALSAGIFVALGLALFAVGYLLGGYAERKAWNALPKEGDLPQPRKHP